MERCQEISQCTPVMAQVTAATAHQTYQGIETEMERAEIEVKPQNRNTLDRNYRTRVTGR